VRIYMSETLVPNDAKGLTSQVADLPSDVFIRVIGVAEATVGVGCGSTAGEGHGLQAAQQVKGGGD
jgi:hypothetical protein